MAQALRAFFFSGTRMTKPPNTTIKAKPTSQASTALKTLRANAIFKTAKSSPLRSLDLKFSLTYRR
jgi:hypothetical protein